MKKSTLAIAIATASGACVAQSSVTVFGVLDASFTYGRGEVSNRKQISNSSLNASRLGFRGTESLGDRLAAGFWIEAGVNNDTGSGQATNTNNTTAGATTGGGMTFNRRATVSLVSPWGEVRLGRDYTPQYINIGAYDPFNNNGVGAPQILVGALNPAAPYGIAAGGATGPLIRASNSIGYFLPSNLGGFSGQAMYYLGENPSNSANAKDGDGYGARAAYTAGAFEISAAVSRSTYRVGNIRTVNVGGWYNFGAVKLMGDAVRDSMSTGLTGKGWMGTFIVPVGTNEIHGSFSTYKTNAAGEPEANKFAVAYQHNLSKRTAVYGSAAHLRNRGGASQALGGSTTTVNGKSSALDVGIRHFF